VRIALAQINTTVGDIAGNERLIASQIEAARERGAAVVLVPELAITGYPPEDLLLKAHFLADASAAVERLAAQTQGIVAVVGFPERAADHVYNSAAILRDGAIAHVYRKVHLPNYGVFDERRYFASGPRGGGHIDVNGVRLGLTICEDIWVQGPPETIEAREGARIILNISASPYHVGKGLEREAMVKRRATDNDAAFVFCALVGGQDELVFDGQSFVVDRRGELIARAPQFTEHLLMCELDPDGTGRPGTIAPLLDTDEETYAALVLGTRDYVTKNGFEHVVIGLSGGVDSTLVALIAVDALGAERVTCVTMPSRYSSEGTRGDAHVLAQNLGVELLELPIEAARAAYDETLAGTFNGHPEDLTEENLQARIRGNLLMALSNKFGWLVLTTGNKSEMSVGYSTLYGDSAGGFAVIKDVPKQTVYRLVAARRRRDPQRDPVPDTIVTRPPSAELRPDQRDQDSLPPYEILDAILEGYVEEDLGREALIARGLPAEDVDRIIRLVDLSEYKRRQNPPGVKITEKAFGRDRRVPITNRYRG
jgi:NAD+ synthase (glutamine-hydrolysing)